MLSEDRDKEILHTQTDKRKHLGATGSGTAQRGSVTVM